MKINWPDPVKHSTFNTIEATVAGAGFNTALSRCEAAGIQALISALTPGAAHAPQVLRELLSEAKSIGRREYAEELAVKDSRSEVQYSPELEDRKRVLECRMDVFLASLLAAFSSKWTVIVEGDLSTYPDSGDNVVLHYEDTHTIGWWDSVMDSFFWARGSIPASDIKGWFRLPPFLTEEKEDDDTGREGKV